MGTGILLILMAALFGSGGQAKVKTKVGKKKGEPDYRPGPVVLDPVDAEDSWIQKVDALISSTPQQGKFFQVKSGSTASWMAGKALGAYNTGSRRRALIKCMTRIGWNDELYASTRHSQAYGGDLFDVEGFNLSAAFLPRHASGPQFVARRELPPRTITLAGAQMGDISGYYGLIWIPKVAIVGGKVQCDASAGPPAWFMNGLV